MLDLKFFICQPTCACIQFTDITGDYVVTVNESGWGAPNIDRSDVVTSTLTITDPNSIVYVIDITTEVQAGTLDIKILSNQLGLATDADIPDGIYKVQWDVIDAITTYTECNEVFLYCVASEKVDKLIANLAAPDIGCSCDGTLDSSTSKALLAFTLLKGLESAACCYKISKFQNFLDAINTLADTENCKNC